MEVIARLYAALSHLGTKSVTVKSLQNPTKNRSKTVKAVLEFIATTGLDLREYRVVATITWIRKGHRV